MVAPYPWVLSFCGHSMGALGDVENGQAFCQKAVRFAHEAKDRLAIAWAEYNFGWFSVHTGNGEKAVEHFKTALPYIEELQLAPLGGTALTGLGWGYYFLEDMQMAQEHAEGAVKTWEDQRQVTFFMGMPYWLLGFIHFDLGDLAQARKYAETALQSAQGNGERWLEANSRILMGRIRAKADMSQSAEAEELISECIRTLDELKLRPWVYQGYLHLGELHADVGQTERALEALKKAEAEFKDMGMDYWLRRTQEVLQRLES